MQQTNSLIDSHETFDDLFTEDERRKFMTQLELPLIIFLLKKLSSKEHPMSVSELRLYLKSLTGIDHSDKTLRRKLQNLCILQKDPDDELINNTLFLTFGGYVVEIFNTSPAIRKKQSRYYFQPLLDDSDVSLICGAIASNRYLSVQEKQYLISREQFLAPLKNDVQIIPDEDIACKADEEQRKLKKKKDPKDFRESEDTKKKYFFPQIHIPPKPVLKDPGSYPKANLLHHVNQLHDAIEKGYAIEIIYGIYDLDDKKFRKIRFHARNKKPYKLNPYALIWNGGSYYLIATHKGYENPVHFRVDRIMAIKPLRQEEDARKYVLRAPIPDSLDPYFQLNEHHALEFLPEKYASVYPLMGIYDEADKLNCYIECTAGTLSILIDTFGTDLVILPSPLEHAENELDIHGHPQQFFAVQIKNVQYDNVVQFCLQQHASITALHPPKLVEDIEKGLLAALERCRKAKSGIDPQHPTRKKS